MIQRYLLLFILGLVVNACASRSDEELTDLASPANLATVESVTFEKDATNEVLKFKSDQELKYNVFKLLDPERIVVDILDAQGAASLPSSLEGSELVQEIKVEPMKDSLSSLVRVEILLKTSANYLANIDDGQLMVRILKGESSQAVDSDISGIAELSPTISDEPEMLPPVASSPAPEVKANEMVAKTEDVVKPEPVIKADPVVKAELPPLVPEAAPQIDAALPPLPEMKLAETKSQEPAEEPEEEIIPLPLPALDQILPPESNDKFPKAKKASELKKKKDSSASLKPVRGGEISGLQDTGNLLTDLDTKIYTGRRISLEFQDADIVDILRLLADVSKLNIVTGEDVKGKLSLKLIDVPWDQALDIALATLSLDKVQHGNIIRVAPADKLRREREVALANDKAAKQLEPLRLKLLNVNYAKAADLGSRIKNILSERGTIDIDDRTNTMIIKDIRDHIEKAENLVKALDTQTPQVRIEARIVLADDQSQNAFGVQWGPSLRLGDGNSKPRSWQFPQTIAAGSPEAGDGDGRISLSNFMVDALPGDAKGGGIGFRLGSVSNIFNLDMQLNYLESESLIRVVSRPSVSVLDNRKAKIIQGSKVPFVTSSSSGTNVSFQEVGISIDVTPQITSDGAVILKVDTKNNEVQNAAVGGNPIITIREASSEMLVKSGRTAVLGGVFRTSETTSSGGVPGLMNLPVVGWLFKNHNRNIERQETLIFITPSILSDNRVAITGASTESAMEP